ncbi:MAG: heparinase, partial [Phycisphaerales bacterium]|nr:heparinase [Phycisphaerales bacterium]
HSHLDLGNFVLDMLGERFAMDLGADNYDLPGYLGPRRADYLRSSTPGHNTLSIGDASQPGDAESTSTLTPDGKSAKIDMTEAYPGARSVVRTVELADGQVTITDAIRVKRDATFIWNLHTPAKVTPTRGGAVLELNGKQVSLSVVEPRDAKVTVEADETRPPELPVQGSTHMQLRVKVQDEATIVVRFQPLAASKRERKL